MNSKSFLPQKMRVKDVRKEFAHRYLDNDIIVDARGSKVIEILSASFIADEDSIFVEPSREYIDAEIAWYESQSLNINDIWDGKKAPPKSWVTTADKHGNVNSNYGYLVWSEDNFNQYRHVVDELRSYPSSRRATIVYTRPSIWNDYKTNGKNDFICTNTVTYYDRGNDKLDCVVQMRSNDAVFGYRNDYAWQYYVLNRLAADLQKYPGTIYWQAQSLHIYERHFEHLDKYIMHNEYFNHFKITEKTI